MDKESSVEPKKKDEKINEIPENKLKSNDKKEDKSENENKNEQNTQNILLGTIHNYTLNELEEKINYKYNEKGELIHKTTGQKCGKIETQKEYELVGKYVEKYLENFLIQKFNLTTLYVPNKNTSDFTKNDKSQAQCKILTTADFPINRRCLIII